MIRRLCRFFKLVVKHDRIPRWLVWVFGVCLLIPGPIDEVLVFPVVAGLLVCRRDVISECWKESR